jgi:hypothetical protein
VLFTHFRLTPAEARIAIGIASGKPLVGVRANTKNLVSRRHPPKGNLNSLFFS